MNFAWSTYLRATRGARILNLQVRVRSGCKKHLKIKGMVTIISKQQLVVPEQKLRALLS